MHGAQMPETSLQRDTVVVCWCCTCGKGVTDDSSIDIDEPEIKTDTRLNYKSKLQTKNH